MVTWFENSEGRLSGSYWLRLEGWGVKRNWTDGKERKLKRTQEGRGKESIKNKEIITNSTEGITYILKNVLKQPMSKERLDNLLQSIHLEKAAEADSESTYALSQETGRRARREQVRGDPCLLRAGAWTMNMKFSSFANQLPFLCNSSSAPL